MAFRSNIDYVGHQRVRQQGIEGVTRAKLETKLRAEAEARRQAAIAASKKKKSSFGRKIIGAVARGAAAYYTGGMSEASGLGAMVDQQIQGGADYERNEYGDIVGAASTMSGMMTAKTANAASTRLNAQSARDDQMQTRMDAISPRAGLDFAEKREAKDAKNRGVFSEYKDGFLNFGKDIDGLDLSTTIIDYSGITPSKKIQVTPAIASGGPAGPPGIINPLVEQPNKPAINVGLTADQQAAVSGTGKYAAPAPETEPINEPVNQGNNLIKAIDYSQPGVI